MVIMRSGRTAGTSVAVGVAEAVGVAVTVAVVVGVVTTVGVLVGVATTVGVGVAVCAAAVPSEAIRPPIAKTRVSKRRRVIQPSFPASTRAVAGGRTIGRLCRIPTRYTGFIRRAATYQPRMTS